jgi:hypothetical protein
VCSLSQSTTPGGRGAEKERPRGDCVLSRPNPFLRVSSHGYGNNGTHTPGSSPHANTMGGTTTNNHLVLEEDAGRVGQSAEEALNSLVEEMKEMLAAPVYDLTPLQDLSQKFWTAMSEARRFNARREEKLEQSLARIKADFLLAREEYEEQLSAERERTDVLRRKLADLTSRSMDTSSVMGNASASAEGGGDAGLHVPYTPNRPRSVASSRSTGSGAGNNPNSSGVFFHFGGSGGGGDADRSGDRSSVSGHRHNNRGGGVISSNQSVASLGSEFALRAKSLVHMMNCQGNDGRGRNVRRGIVEEEDVGRRSMGGSPR